MPRKNPLIFLQHALLIFMLSTMSNTTFGQDKLALCLDSNFWYPFTLSKNEQATGIHIDIINQALSDLDYQVTYTALPWKRCLLGVEQGTFDGVATASYKAERNRYLHYPADAATTLSSPLRVMLVEYVVVTLADHNYHFDGSPQSIPQPVRAPHGYSIVEDLKKVGLEVDDASYGDESNFRKLLRHRTGAVVAIPETAHELSKRPEYQDKLRISTKSFRAKSYYLPFSRKSSLTASQRLKIWQQIAHIRNNSALMAEFASKY